jgi:hypothetical protein
VLVSPEAFFSMIALRSLSTAPSDVKPPGARRPVWPCVSATIGRCPSWTGHGVRDPKPIAYCTDSGTSC